MGLIRRSSLEPRFTDGSLSTSLDELVDFFGARIVVMNAAFRPWQYQRLPKLTLGTGKGSVPKQVAGLRKFVKGSLGDIRALLTGKHAIPAVVRQELTRHIESITLLPDGEAVKYKGQWRLLGSGYRDGAEGMVCTVLPTSEIAVTFEGVFRRAA